MYKVYKIVNVDGVVEYVGQTNNPKRRFKDHTCVDPKHRGSGKFYKRTDVHMEIISECETKVLARAEEVKWQIFYNVIDHNYIPQRTFTTEQVLNIRSSTKSQRAIAIEFNTSQRTVWQIKNYTTYRELP